MSPRWRACLEEKRLDLGPRLSDLAVGRRQATRFASIGLASLCCTNNARRPPRLLVSSVVVLSQLPC